MHWLAGPMPMMRNLPAALVAVFVADIWLRSDALGTVRDASAIAM